MLFFKSGKKVFSGGNYSSKIRFASQINDVSKGMKKAI